MKRTLFYLWDVRLLIVISFFILFSESHAQTRVIFYTSMGEFEVTLNDTITPITAGNFKSLVEQKYYDGVIFHRVIDGFMIQGGDPTGTGSGGPGYTIDDEFDIRMSNVQRTISMANSGPNSAGSQFFINLVDNTYLDFNKSPFTSKHAVFGEVTLGFEVVQAIGKVQTNAQNRPEVDVVMDSIRVVKPKGDPQSPPARYGVNGNPLTPDSWLFVVSDEARIAVLTCYDRIGRVVWERSIELEVGQNIISLISLYNEISVAGIYRLNIGAMGNVMISGG